MTDIAQARRVLISNSSRGSEIVGTLAEYGFSSWVAGVPDKFRSMVSSVPDPDLAEMTDGERAVQVFLELGTTFIKAWPRWHRRRAGPMRIRHGF